MRELGVSAIKWVGRPSVHDINAADDVDDIVLSTVRAVAYLGFCDPLTAVHFLHRHTVFMMARRLVDCWSHGEGAALFSGRKDARLLMLQAAEKAPTPEERAQGSVEGTRAACTSCACASGLPRQEQEGPTTV